MLPQALAGILSFSFLFTGSTSNVRHGPVPPSNATNASAGPRRYLSFSFLFSLQMLPQALAGISVSLFSFLFTGSQSDVRQGRSRPQTLQMLPQPLAGISLSLFSFLFTGSKSNVRQGRSRLQTLQMLPQALPGISLSLFSFLFTGSKSNVRHGRSRPQTLQMLPQAKDRERHKACEIETETEKRKRPRQRLRQRQPPGATRRAEVTSACASLFFVSFLFWHVPFRFLAWLPSGCVMLDVNLAERTG